METGGRTTGREDREGEDQKDPEDIRRETVMWWRRGMPGGGGEESFRCWVKAAIEQEAGSPKRLKTLEV